MINIYYISASWCKSCKDIKSEIKYYIESLDKTKFVYQEFDMEDDVEEINNMNVEITKLPSLIINNESNTIIIPNKDIKSYFESICINDDYDF